MNAVDYRETAKYKNRWLTLVVLSISLVIIVIDNTIVNVAIPTMQRDLGATASELQWIVDAYILVYAGLLMTMGTLGDRFGRKRTLQMGLLIFPAFAIFGAYSSSAAHLIVARSFMGIGGALIMPSTLSILVDVFPRDERARAIGVWTGVAALGIPLGPVLGGWLLEHYWWGSVFLINVPIAVIAIIAGVFLVPNSRDPNAGRIDVLGALLSTAMLGSLVYAIIEGPAEGWTSVAVVGGFIGFAVFGAAFAAWERRNAKPLLNLSFFRDMRFTIGASTITFASLAMVGVMFVLVQYLQFVLGYTPFEAGLRMLPFVVGFIVAAGSAGRLASAGHGKKAILAGMVVAAVTLGASSMLTVDSPYWTIAAMLVALGYGVGSTLIPSTDAVLASVPEANAGVGSAVNDTARQIGAALGVGIIGSALSSGYSSAIGNAVAHLPSNLAAAASDSVGAALHVASTIGEPAGEALRQQAFSAFMSGYAAAAIVGAAIMAVGAVLVVTLLPARDKAEAVEVAPAEIPA